MISVVQYWPFFTTKEIRVFSYSDVEKKVLPFSSTFSYDATTNSMLCMDYDNGVYSDTWYIQYDTNLGVKEWRDDYPQTNSFLAYVFGPTRKQVLSAPILWGNKVTIVEIVSSAPKYSFFGSTPPLWGSGVQKVEFEELRSSIKLHNGMEYKDILVFSYRQTWNGKTTGARYFMANGVGPVAISWLGYDAAGNVTVTEPRCDAMVTHL